MAVSAEAELTGRIAVTPPSLYAGQWRTRLNRISEEAPQSAHDLARGDSVVVLGAHPDDETLGLGASISELASEGVDVHLVCLTSGEAALDHIEFRVPGLAERRRNEFACAAQCLGAASGVARVDLCLARLVEGHADGLRIIQQAGHHAHEGVYGVWASRSVGTGTKAANLDGRWHVEGELRLPPASTSSTVPSCLHSSMMTTTSCSTSRPAASSPTTTLGAPAA